MGIRFYVVLLIVCICFTQKVQAHMYECSYKKLNGIYTIQSFNSFIEERKDYPELSLALKRGYCRELLIKKYFLNGTACNIQFYKDTKEIAGLSCYKNNKIALKKLKEIAKKEFGYNR